jgi:hypothetical protein
VVTCVRADVRVCVQAAPHLCLRLYLAVACGAQLDDLCQRHVVMPLGAHDRVSCYTTYAS